MNKKMSDKNTFQSMTCHRINKTSVTSGAGIIYPKLQENLLKSTKNYLPTEINYLPTEIYINYLPFEIYVSYLPIEIYLSHLP
jgi:hypothetical protein